MHSNIIDFAFFKRFHIIFTLEKDEIEFFLKYGEKIAKEKKRCLGKKRKNSLLSEKVIPLLK